MKVGLVHSDYPFKMKPRVDVWIRKGLPEGESIGTPNISYKEMGIDSSYEINTEHTIRDKNYLWERFLGEYNSSLKKARERINTLEVSCDDLGTPTDLSWLDEKVYLGGCFLEGCLHNAIRRIQIELLEKKQEPVVYLIPEIVLCAKQPAQVTFMEEVKSMNTIDFHYKKGFDFKVLNNKVKLVGLENLIKKQNEI